MFWHIISFAPHDKLGRLAPSSYVTNCVMRADSGRRSAIAIVIDAVTAVTTCRRGERCGTYLSNKANTTTPAATS